MIRLMLLGMLFSLCGFGQNKVYTKTDSIRYFKDEFTRFQKELEKSLNNNPEFILLRNRFVAYNRRHNDYSGMTLFANMLQSDYSSFNRQIAAAGFPALSSLSFGFGIGASSKRDHIIFDFYFSSLYLANTSKKEREKISSSLGNLFLMDLGYDLLHSNKWSIYPYAGLSLRMASLNYQNKGVFNPSYTNISDLLDGEENVFTTSSRLGYQAGLGIDVVLGNNDEYSGATLFFIKAGINKPFGKDKYKIREVRYDPDIDKGNLAISAGFKFVSRR